MIYLKKVLYAKNNIVNENIEIIEWQHIINQPTVLSILSVIRYDQIKQESEV